MWLDDLEQTVQTLADRIKHHEHTLRGNERATRYALIDPLLASLGWNLADPSEVVAEYPLPDGRADYAMLYDGEPYLIVEAKNLGDQLMKGHQQVAQYAMVAGVQFVVLTNGKRWLGYSLGKIGDKQVFEFNVTAPQVLELLWLWHGNFKGRTTQPRIHERSDKAVSTSVTPSPISPKRAASGAPLPEVNYTRGMKKPRRLIFPDGTTKDVTKNWASVQPVTAEWLVDGKYVKSLPLRNQQGTYLLHKEPKKKTGKPFRSAREVRKGHWIDMNFGPKDHLTKAKELLESCGVDPATVHLELD